MVIYLERDANDLHMVQLMPLPPIISFFIKIQIGFSLVLPFWCQLTQVVVEKRPLNKCVVCVCLSAFSVARLPVC